MTGCLTGAKIVHKNFLNQKEKIIKEIKEVVQNNFFKFEIKYFFGFSTSYCLVSVLC
jgi:hypothetical protein